MNIFNIDFKRLALLLLPTFLRTQSINILLFNLLAPLEQLHGNLLNFRNEIENRMSYNSQVFSLRKMLNDKFDPSLRRITIGNGEQRSNLMLYRREEEKPLMLGKVMLNRQDVISASAEFIINVPKSIYDSSETEIRSWVNYYKLPTKIPVIKPK